MFVVKNKWDLDKKNERIVIYMPNVREEDIKRLEELSSMEFDFRLTKVIIYTTTEGKDLLKKIDYKSEATLSGFFYGKDAWVCTRYFNNNRDTSKTSEENKKVLSIVLSDKKDIMEHECPYSVEMLSDMDIPRLAKLYQTVFPVYPTNIVCPDYLVEAKKTDYLFAVVKDKGEIIGAASAMDSGYGSAEMTDCAVSPNYRGANILHYILLFLENELRAREIFNVYSITRATSIGMNMTVKRLGYKYEGTLTNNCIISTGFEDMNIWTKKLT